jgi:hypothetical protein
MLDDGLLQLNEMLDVWNMSGNKLLWFLEGAR